MLADLTLEKLAPFIGTTFRTEAGGRAVDLVLLEAVAIDPAPPAAPDRRRQFSLLFRGPADLSPHQGIYALDHVQLGHLEIFLVPIHPDANGCLLEAVFT